MEKGKMGPVLLLDPLVKDQDISGIVIVDKDIVEAWSKKFVDWYIHIILVHTEFPEEAVASQWLDDVEGRPILVSRLSEQELLEVSDLEHHDVKRLIPLGKIELDRKGHIESVKSIMLGRTPLHEQVVLSRFANFVEAYVHGRRYLEKGHVWDAYTSVLTALKEWACLTVVEHGKHDQVGLWEQVKHLSPGVFKLYEELATSNETVLQRVELVLLACEFSITTKLNSCAAPLLRILRESKQGVSLEQLYEREELQIIRKQLPMLMEKLTRSHYVIKTTEPSSDPHYPEALYSIYHWNEERKAVHG